VPVRTKIIPALVLSQHTEKPKNIYFTIKDVHAIEPLPSDKYYFPFIEKLSNYYHIDSLHFIKRISHFLLHKKNNTEKIILPPESGNYVSTTSLTPEQQAVIQFLLPAINNQRYTPTVLHGVTGSGKTEVYKAAITYALEQN